MVPAGRRPATRPKSPALAAAHAAAEEKIAAARAEIQARVAAAQARSRERIAAQRAARLAKPRDVRRAASTARPSIARIVSVPPRRKKTR